MKYIIVKETDYGYFYVENNHNSIEDKATVENLANALQKAVDLKEGNKVKYHTTSTLRIRGSMQAPAIK